MCLFFVQLLGVIARSPQGQGTQAGGNKFKIRRNKIQTSGNESQIRGSESQTPFFRVLGLIKGLASIPASAAVVSAISPAAHIREQPVMAVSVFRKAIVATTLAHKIC
jgi:hypothetical protein